VEGQWRDSGGREGEREREGEIERCRDRDDNYKRTYRETNSHGRNEGAGTGTLDLCFTLRAGWLVT